MERLLQFWKQSLGIVSIDEGSHKDRRTKGVQVSISLQRIRRPSTAAHVLGNPCGLGDREQMSVED
jgi:hypothetical protein